MNVKDEAQKIIDDTVSMINESEKKLDEMSRRDKKYERIFYLPIIGIIIIFLIVLFMVMR